MASDFTPSPPSLGVPTLHEIEDEEGTSTATYPHLVTRGGISFFLRTCIDVRIGPPEVDICNDTPQHGGAYVQHPEPFDADGTLSTACRTLLITSVQDAVGRCQFPIQQCIVWSPTSCSYVDPDGSIFETACGVALPARIAFEAAQPILLRAIYPQINIAGPSGFIWEACPANATRKEIVARIVGIVMMTGRRARVVWSKSEVICAELTDKMGTLSSGVKPCAVWSASETIDSDPASWHATLGLKYPHIVAGGHKEYVLLYPDTMEKEELIAAAAEILAKGAPRAYVAWSPTELIRPKA